MKSSLIVLVLAGLAGCADDEGNPDPSGTETGGKEDGLPKSPRPRVTGNIPESQAGFAVIAATLDGDEFVLAVSCQSECRTDPWHLDWTGESTVTDGQRVFSFTLVSDAPPAPDGLDVAHEIPLRFFMGHIRAAFPQQTLVYEVGGGTSEAVFARTVYPGPVQPLTVSRPLPPTDGDFGVIGSSLDGEKVLTLQVMCSGDCANHAWTLHWDGLAHANAAAHVSEAWLVLTEDKRGDTTEIAPESPFEVRFNVSKPLEAADHLLINGGAGEALVIRPL